MHPVAWGAGGSIVFGFTLLLVGSPQAARRNIGTAALEPVEFSELRTTANRLFGSGAFGEAADLYASGYRRSVSARNQHSATLFLTGLGGAKFATYQYQDALEAFFEARRIAESRNDFTSLGMIWSNLSSLYLAVGDLRASRVAAERALSAASNTTAIAYRGQLLAQVGFVHSQSGETEEALHYFRQAVEALDGATDVGMRASVLSVIGRQLLHTGDYDGAERYLTEAFRLQKMFQGPNLRFTYFALSELRLAQGAVGPAAILIDRAFEMPATVAGLTSWLLFRQRAEVQLAENRIPEAVDSFGRALEAAREWREEAAPSDPSRISTDAGLHRLYSAFIEASFRLPRPPLKDVFLAVEEDRAAALRREMLSARDWPKSEGFEYWEKLAQLRASETQRISNDTAHNRARVQQIGFELNELEARNKIGDPRFIRYGADTRFEPGMALRDLQARLRPEEALLSFYQGEQRTYLWAITRDRFEFHLLSDSRALSSLAERFWRAVQTRSAVRDELGERLHRELFSQLSKEVLRKLCWLVTADDTLFDAPLAALSVRRGSTRVYLMEEHSIQRIPSALMLAASPGRLRLGSFIGIGDGIYNIADSRWTRDKRSKTSLELARLVASSEELRNCAHEWAGISGTSPILLTGIYASRQALQDILSQNKTGVIHIASHILWPRDRPDEALIDLGLSHSGESEVLTSEDIGHLYAPGALVIMSGCNSGAMQSVPGTGVTGLVRAWLIAGASMVVGSRWPTPDDSGELFQSFYRHLRTGRNTGSIRALTDAMRDAQLDMLHSGTWRSDPSYWGAFYLLGKE
jgi:CHAT domain-containing protein/Tfp pilus assembly protein PilF